jgi:regulator of protease activity HflC (stomatin/prohibitin superfamily)
MSTRPNPGSRQDAAPAFLGPGHSSGEDVMVNYLSSIVFVALMLPGLALAVSLGGPRAVLVVVLWGLVATYAASAVRLAAEWERAVVFRLGKLSSVKGPGVYLVIPLIDQVRVIETRVQTLEIARQQVITKDNVPVSIDGVLFFRVDDAAQAVVKVQDFRFAISQYARTSLRDVIGQMTLDELLSEREQIEFAIGSHVEKDTSAWGLHVVAIRMEDIDMPEELKKMMSRQASAEREKRANITKAEGDRDAAVNLATAAQTMRESPGAMQLRTLQTIDGLGPTASNTVVLAIPVEVMNVLTEATSFLKDRRLA